MDNFNKYDTKANPDWNPDALVELTLFTSEEGGSEIEVTNGFSPQYKVKDDYLTSTFHFFIENESIKPGETCKAFVKFITPGAYPNSLKAGAQVSVQVGSRVIGQATLLEVYNEGLANDR